MFTGLVREKGRVLCPATATGQSRLSVEAPAVAAGSAIGDSIAVNGVCLTVTAIEEKRTLHFDVSPETLSRTTLGRRKPGDEVNLEPALAATSLLGGHFVLGHVDGVGRVVSVRQGQDSWGVRFRVPAELSRYLVPKGSVAVDGVSLTVNEVRGDTFSVTLIPQTLRSVTLGAARAGTEVNIETDVLVRSIERLMEAGGRSSGIRP